MKLDTIMVLGCVSRMPTHIIVRIVGDVPERISETEIGISQRFRPEKVSEECFSGPDKSIVTISIQVSYS